MPVYKGFVKEDIRIKREFERESVCVVYHKSLAVALKEQIRIYPKDVDMGRLAARKLKLLNAMKRSYFSRKEGMSVKGRYRGRQIWYSGTTTPWLIECIAGVYTNIFWRNKDKFEKLHTQRTSNKWGAR